VSKTKPRPPRTALERISTEHPARSGLEGVPLSDDAVEGGDGLLEPVLVFLVQVAGLAREPPGGVGDLVARAEHLGVEALERSALGGVAERLERQPRGPDALLARPEHALPVRPLVRVHALGVRRVLERVSGLGPGLGVDVTLAHGLALGHGVGSWRDGTGRSGRALGDATSRPSPGLAL